MSSADIPLYLELNLQQVQFNSCGQFYLTILIQGSIEKQNDVKLFVNKSKSAHGQSYFTTEPYLQSVLGEPINLAGSVLVFQLPPGFIEQDVYLIVEAHKFSHDTHVEEDSKYGESVVLVYPNKDSLFPSTHHVKTSKQDNYKIEKLLALTAETELEDVAINVGSLWLKGELRQKLEEKSQPAKKQSSNLMSLPDDPGPSQSPPEQDVELTHSSCGKVSELPLGSSSSPAHPRHLCGSYVARQGYAEVAVLVHAAVGLPVKTDGTFPHAFVIGKSRQDHDQGLQSQAVTHTVGQQTQNPTWHEVLLVEFPGDQSQYRELIVIIADSPSQDILVEYEIPISNLKPFYQYNLELVKPNKDLNNSSRLYLSLILKYDNLIAHSDNMTMFGMEFLLRGFESPIPNQLGSLLAVARVVPDWHEYKKTTLSSHPRSANVPSTTISFPSPHPTSFSVAGQAMGSGSPQVTVCGEPVNHPQWNQMFFFPGDMEALFDGNSAIVVEFYSKSHALRDDSWLLIGPVGYCSQVLNKELLASLQQDNAKLGLKINGLPVQGNISTITGTKASVGLVVRCLVDKRPEELSLSQLSSLPLFGEKNPTVKQFTAQPIIHHDKNPFGLPPFDAVKRLLPFANLQMSSEPLMLHAAPLPITTNADASSLPSDLRSTMDMRTLALLDYQMKEVDRYRTAMRKLAADLLQLKQENSRLEEANSQYRRDLSQHDEISRMMVSANDLDNVTHTELIQKFVLLKKKLSDESTKRQELQKRTQKLQNDLIKKNEKEKSLLKLEEAHESQQALVQKMQIKLQKYKSLQETCKKQEQVIIELEKLLSKGDNGVNLSDQSSQSRIYIEENVRLRLELENLKVKVKETDPKKESARTASPAAAKIKDLDNSERLELYQKLERAEGRILGLEQQLTENARKWAKEKTSLQAKLNEALMEKQSRLQSFVGNQVMQDMGSQLGSNFFYSEHRKSSPKLDPLIRR